MTSLCIGERVEINAQCDRLRTFSLISPASLISFFGVEIPKCDSVSRFIRWLHFVRIPPVGPEK